MLDHLASLGENNQLSLKQPHSESSSLMALVQASRSSELHALDVRFWMYGPDGVVFTLPVLTKKRKVGVPAKELFFGSYSVYSRLCVVQCLRQYEQATLKFHTKRRDTPDPFLSYIKPNKPVTSQRITHCIKDLLKEAGIDVSIFKAHSVRGASTTAVLSSGVSVADIFHTADWCSDTTFHRFYYCPSGNTYLFTQAVET